MKKTSMPFKSFFFCCIFFVIGLLVGKRRGRESLEKEIRCEMNAAIKELPITGSGVVYWLNENIPSLRAAFKKGEPLIEEKKEKKLSK